MGTDIKTLQKMGGQTVTALTGSDVKDYFEKQLPTIRSQIARSAMTPDKLVKLALGALRQTPDLRECTLDSLLGATLVCARLGLECNTPLGQAYLVPFNRNVAKKGQPKKWRKDVQTIIGYRGMLSLARRSGEIQSISARSVREHDEFHLAYGVEDNITHTPARGNAGPIIGFYAVAKFKDGGSQFEFLWREDVDAIMARSQSRGEYGPWKDNYEEMGRKTAIRRLFKYLPQATDDMAYAASLDESAGTDRQDSALALEGEYSVVESLPNPDEDEGPSDAVDDGSEAPARDNSKDVTQQSKVPRQHGEFFLDDRDVIWDQGLHSANKTINADGSFRKGRGVEDGDLQRGEQMLLVHNDGTEELVNYHSWSTGPGAEGKPAEKPEEDDPFGGMRE